MINEIKRIIQLLVLLLLLVPSIGCADVIARPEFNGYVYDYSNVISASDEMMINAYAATVESMGAGQIIVVTVDSLSGMTAADYGLELFNSWGIGRAEVNDGLLIMLAPNERYVQICTGSGIDNLVTDEECGILIDEFAIPFFSKNEFSKGMLYLTKATCIELALERSTLFDDKEMIKSVIAIDYGDF